MSSVVVRRISDGKWLNGGSGRLAHFAQKARSLKSHSKAIMVIRCDIGDDLDGYEILPAEKAQEK